MLPKSKGAKKIYNKENYMEMPTLPMTLKNNNLTSHLLERNTEELHQSNNILSSTPKSTKEVISSETTPQCRSLLLNVGQDTPMSTKSIISSDSMQCRPLLLNVGQDTPMSTKSIISSDSIAATLSLIVRKLNVLQAQYSQLDEKMNEMSTILMECQNKLFNGTTNENGNDAPLETKMCEMLPIDNDPMLLKLELFLKGSSKVMAKELSRIGGAATKEISKRIMYRTFTNKFGELYSWDGGKGKRKFKEMKSIVNLIFEAVRLNKRTMNAYEDEIIAGIKMWLVKAKERRINEEKKNEQKNEDAPNRQYI